MTVDPDEDFKSETRFKKIFVVSDFESFYTIENSGNVYYDKYENDTYVEKIGLSGFCLEKEFFRESR